MQELYLYLESFKKITNTISITDIQRMIGNILLEKEKEQITEAYEEGRDYGLCLNGNEYYENTYKK